MWELLRRAMSKQDNWSSIARELRYIEDINIKSKCEIQWEVLTYDLHLFRHKTSYVHNVSSLDKWLIEAYQSNHNHSATSYVV